MKRFDASIFFLWLVLVPAGLLAVVMVVLIFFLLPGGSLLVAAGCFTDGHCESSVVRAGHTFTGHYAGGMAYFYGALLVSLAVLMANIVVTDGPWLSSLTTYKDAQGKERTRYSGLYFCLMVGFLVLDTALVRALVFAMERR